MDIVFKIEELSKVTHAFLTEIGTTKCIAFHGEMGVGKTTFISSVCKQLGVISNVSSPTFSIINEYSTIDKNTVYHIDLYRLKNESEAIATGVEDCMHSGSFCFVEWPERTPGIFPKETVHCFLSIVGPDERKLKIML
jgi:tRNA threonylcarbamoyladenosine biosynthesis protein TsaE